MGRGGRTGCEGGIERRGGEREIKGDTRIWRGGGLGLGLGLRNCVRTRHGYGGVRAAVYKNEEH